jgi:hypothetical protein
VNFKSLTFLLVFLVEPPEFKDAPELTISVNKTSMETEFHCSFTQLDIANLQYSVQWYLNDKQLKEETLVNDTDSSLQETYITQLFYEDKVGSQMVFDIKVHFQRILT